MAATVSAWGKPGAWALDSEEHEDELLQQRKEESANGSNKAATATATALSDFPSLATAASAKTKKKNKGQTLSLQEFTTYGVAKPAPSSSQPKGLTHDEIRMLPTGPRERSAEELDRTKLGGGFRSYGGGDESSKSRWGPSRGASDEPHREGGGFGRDSNRELAPSRADEVDDWGATKKSTIGNGFERRERGERGGFFSDSQSRADDSDSWSSNKSFVPSEGRRSERRVGFQSDGGADSENWGKKKEEEGRRPGGVAGSAFDSLRERRGGYDSVESDNWGKKREEGNGSGRPRLNLQPRTLPVVGDGQQNGSETVVKPKGLNPFGEAKPREEVLKEKGKDWKEIDEKLEMVKIKDDGQQNGSETVVKPKASNPFGEAKPREEVLKEKGKDWKEIDEKLEMMKIKDDGLSFGSFGSGNGKVSLPEDREERSWRKIVSNGLSPQSSERTQNALPEEAEDRDTKM